MDYSNNNLAIALDTLHRMLQVEREFISSGQEDYSGIATVFHPDIVLHEPAILPYAGDWKGQKGIGQLFREMHNFWESLTSEDLHILSENDRIVMHCTLVGRIRSNQVEIRQPFAQVVRLKEGMIIECTPFYFDAFSIMSH
jgi:ketosteroid isomerase-like protein